MTAYIVKAILKRLFKLATWLIYAVTLLAAYGGYFNPQWWTIPSIGVLFFPYLAMATLILAAVWLICRKFFTGVAGIGVLMLCGPTFLEALPFRFGNTASNEERTFKLVTFNCLHFIDLDHNDYPPFNRSLNFLINSGADFICLQEFLSFEKAKIDKKYKSQIDSLNRLYPYSSQTSSREIEFYSKYPIEKLDVKLGEGVKFYSVGAYRINIEGEDLTIINVHLSSFRLSEEERNIIIEAQSEAGLKKSVKEMEGSVYKKMRKAFQERARISHAIAEYAGGVKGNVVLCGDFNDVPGSWTYRNFIRNGFHDAYAQTGFGHLITYNRHLMWFHIDQILYKGELVPLYVRKERLDASDHFPLVAEFEFL